MIKVLMIDDNKELIKALYNYFNIKKDIIISDQFYNGKDAIDYISKNNDYDLIVLDLILPKKDGLCILKHLKEKGINKPVIISTSFYNDNMIKKLSHYNIEYIYAKPYEYENLEENILKIFKHNKEYSNISLENKISTILKELGIPSNIKGYKYIKEGIVIYLNTNVESIMNDIYGTISKKYNTKISRVESAIRHAVEISCIRGDLNLINKLFGNSIDCNKAKPTNSDFIITLSEKIKLGYNMNI